MTPVAITLICALSIALGVAAALAAAWRSEAIETRRDVRKLRGELDERPLTSPPATAAAAPESNPPHEDKRWVIGIHSGAVYVRARGMFEAWVPVANARLYAAQFSAMADLLDPPRKPDPTPESEIKAEGDKP